MFERAVAERMVDERQVILDTLNRAGVLTLDVEADKLSIAVINKYLELKSPQHLVIHVAWIWQRCGGNLKKAADLL